MGFRNSRTGVLLLAAVLFMLSALLGQDKVYSDNRDDSNGAATALYRAEKLMIGMTLEEKIGQLFMLDFRKKDNRDVLSLDKGIRDDLKKYKPGGIVLFRENTVETLQTLKLVRDYQKSSPKIPLFIGIDQEGGAVTRLQSGTVMPGNMALGAANDRELVYAVAKATGAELKAVGINMNFAPAVDVNNNPANPVIGIRSFGDRPETVADFGVEYMKGLHAAGVIAVAKHFPGHGDTAVDSHIDLPTVSHGLDRLEQLEFVPFESMIKNGVEMVMTAHVTFPAIDDREGLPATLSYHSLTGLLRDKMRFRGVVITDAFSMKAITDRYGDKEATAMAIKAGADIVLMPQNISDTFNYIREQVKSGAIPEARINSSVKRILALKIKSGIIRQGININLWPKQQALKIVGGTEHAFIRKTVAERAVTLVKNEDRNLPFRLEEHQRIVFFAPSPTGTGRVHQALQPLIGSPSRIQGFNYDGQRVLTSDQKEAIEQSDFILLFTRTMKASDVSPDSFMPEFVANLVKTVDGSGKKVVAVSVRNPYDLQVLPNVKSYIAAYSDWGGGGVEAAVRVIFGKINPIGKLPVSIPDGDGQILYPHGHGLSYPMDGMVTNQESETVETSLSELWSKGILEEIEFFRPGDPVDGQRMVTLLKRMILVTRGQTFEPGSYPKRLSRNEMIQLFIKAARTAGIDRASVKEWFESRLTGEAKGTQAEMIQAAARFVKFLETSTMKAGGSDR